MKTVFSKTQDVCDLWAAQSQTGARTGSNTRFRGSTLYSYGTAIAHMTCVPCRLPVTHIALISSRSYSTSTAKVQGEARHAATERNIAVFTVPNLGDDAGSIILNIAYLADRVTETLDKLRRGRPSSIASYRNAAKAQIALANHFAETFRQGWRYSGPHPDDVKHTSEVTA